MLSPKKNNKNTVHTNINKQMPKNGTWNKKWSTKRDMVSHLKTTFPCIPCELQFDNQPIRAMTERHVT